MEKNDDIKNTLWKIEKNEVKKTYRYEPPDYRDQLRGKSFLDGLVYMER